MGNNRWSSYRTAKTQPEGIWATHTPQDSALPRESSTSAPVQVRLQSWYIWDLDASMGNIHHTHMAGNMGLLKNTQ